MRINKIFNNLPQVITAIFLALSFYLLARTISGYTQNQQHLIILSDIAMSVGLFAVVIPACSLLSIQKSEHLNYNKLKLTSVVLSLIIVLMSLFLIFKSQIGDYFGLEQAPRNYVFVFSLLLLTAIVSSLLYLSNAVRKLPADKYLDNWPLIFHFAACGIGLSLICLLILKAQDTLEATVVLAGFLRRLVLVGAVGQIFMSLVNSATISKAKKATCFFGLVIFLGSFQTSNLTVSSNEAFYAFNQFLQMTGVGLIIFSTLSLLIKIWKQNFSEILNRGLWVVHGIFLSSLILLALNNSSFGLINVSTIFQSFVYLIICLAVPILFKNLLEKRSPSSSVVTYLSQVLNWSGIFICLITTLALSPYGANLVSVQTLAFKPFLLLLVCGLFLLVLSYLISLWNRILQELI